MKPRPALSVLFCFLLGYCLFSCHKTEFKPGLTLSANTLLLDSTIGAEDTFSISSNVSWKLTVSPAAATSWLQVSQTTGSNDAIIKLTITGNNTNVTQPVTITVEPTGNVNLAPQTITLGQKGTLQANKTSITLAGTPATDTVSISTSLAWKATASASWIHLDTTQGAGVYRLKISADTNRTAAAQNGTVTLTPLNNSNASALTINVTQKAFYAILNFSPLSGKVGSTITLNGYFPSNFNVTMNNSSTATIVSHTATQIVCTVPADATGGYLFINISGVPIPVVSSQQFTISSGWVKRSDNSAGLVNFTANAVAYSYNGSLYIGWGVDNAHTIYRLDTTNFHWVAAITIPSTVKVLASPTWFVINNKLYVGAGYCTDCFNFYEYDMTQGNSPAAWRQLTSFPENMLNGSGFALGGYGYAQTGEFTPAGNNIMYKFSTSGPSDPGTWTALGPLNIKDGPAASFVIGNTAYFGGGTATAITDPMPNQFYAMTPPSITLTATALVPGQGSLGPGQRFSTWTVGNIAYAFDYSNQTLFSYSPAGDSWTNISTIPGNLYSTHATGFNGHIYAWNSSGAIIEYLP